MFSTKSCKRQRFGIYFIAMPPKHFAKTVLFCGFFSILLPASYSFAYFSKSPIIKNNTISVKGVALNLETPTSASKTVCGLLNAKNWTSLYQISAEEVKQSFTETDFVNSFNASNIQSCEIKSDPIYLSSTWAKTSIEISYSNLSSKPFYLALKKEGEEWRMFGTEEKL
jgi:hypothetical protein